MNADNYGVPQSRERLILIGHRSELNFPFAYPEAKTQRASKAADLFLPKTPTCFEALGDLPDIDQIASLKNCDSVNYSFEEGFSEFSTRCGLSKKDWLLVTHANGT